MLKVSREGIELEKEAEQLIKEIEQKSNISIEQIYQIAQAIQGENLSNEAVVRPLVRQLATLANRRLTMEQEERIVQAVLQRDVPTTIEGLTRYLD